jgi:hypothetical protein
MDAHRTNAQDAPHITQLRRARNRRPCVLDYPFSSLSNALASFQSTVS